MVQNKKKITHKKSHDFYFNSIDMLKKKLYQSRLYNIETQQRLLKKVIDIDTHVYAPIIVYYMLDI